MGTSQSKPSLGGGKPLVPSWGDQDPAPPADGAGDGAAAGQPVPPSIAQPQAPPAVGQPQAAPPVPRRQLPPRPLAGMRRALRDYYGSGSRQDARKAAGRFARSVGAGGGARYARAARTGGTVLAAMARAGNNMAPVAGALDLRTLAGRPVDEVITEIVDAFCPTGILDEEAIRIAIGEALFESLGNAAIFTPNAVNDFTILAATRCFVAEIVFASIMAEAGQSANNVTPAQAVARENGLRDLVREVTDLEGTPIFQNAGALLTPQALEGVVAHITDAVLREMREWE